MEISAAIVKELRDKTGISIMKCKEALIEAKGDMDVAIDILRTRIKGDVSKRAARAALQGVIGSYVHFDNKLGTLVEVNCETDFVANTDDFKILAREIAMHVAAANPTYLAALNVPPEVIEKEKAIYREQVADKPPQAIDGIVEGKLKKFYADTCLMEQPFVKDQQITIRDLVQQLIGKTGENIVIRKFVRFRLGE